MAMEYLSPSAVSFLQICFATVAVLGIKSVGFSDVDWFDWEKSKAYGIYVVVFVGAIYTNMQALRSSNVETVIIFRACSPMAVAAFDYMFLGREAPNMRSLASLIIVAIGAFAYCVNDSQLTMHGIQAYYWVFGYYVLIVIEMTYGKMLTSNIKMNSVWGPVLYCNAFSVLPMFLLSYGSGDMEMETLLPTISQISPLGYGVLLFSCIVGTLIGYTGWLCRGMVSATTFTLVGVVNKFLTVLLNVLVWDKHSTPAGIAAVCLCLLAGAFYQQAPRRDVQKTLEEPQQQVQAAKSRSAPAVLVEMTETSRSVHTAGTTKLTKSPQSDKLEQEEIEPLLAS
eukprot:CAMPEP_0174973446 /NCGR_PEP_ID=MMETSP0004_2-20121128/11248_1 /TAXON_ID=420556 /ORGANISM="Ochromonas sp., Strain CCMP1393" /LENGTH=338 /DNA_ID=CAMNT_0016223899 /DNA_START=155 /DNA_END=1171 /DNA_ORIENTATION=+